MIRRVRIKNEASIQISNLEKKIIKALSVNETHDNKSRYKKLVVVKVE